MMLFNLMGLCCVLLPNFCFRLQLSSAMPRIVAVIIPVKIVHFFQALDFRSFKKWFLVGTW